ncbi:MAG: hypothetical protein QM699_13530 [Amaricoccus sp.]|uniref:hypothetical protein n=1 Tax=Amaricoccus sp. TaxID=1872485 RepID=UPI0039E228DA
MAKSKYPLEFEEDSNENLEALESDISPYVAPWPFPWACPHPQFFVDELDTHGKECHRFNLAQIKNWPEVKTDFKLKCVKVFGKRICTKVPVVYHRTCTKYAFVNICYPTGGLQDVTDCVVGAGLASAVAAVVSGGSAAAGTFKAALETCLIAKEVAWADQVTVTAGWDSKCGPWH